MGQQSRFFGAVLEFKPEQSIEVDLYSFRKGKEPTVKSFAYNSTEPDIASKIHEFLKPFWAM